MPRKKWKPTPEYIHRNRWLNKTSGIALRALRDKHKDEFDKILREVRRIIPYKEYIPEVTDETSSTS